MMDTIVVLLVLAGVAFGVYMFVEGRKKKGTAGVVPDLPASVHAEVVALGQKALDIADGLRKTVHQQATVIAAPPVQAAINASPIPVDAAPQTVQPAPDVKVDKGGTPVATTQSAPVPPPPRPAMPPEDLAEREMVEKAEAFGYGSPPYNALLARAGGSQVIANQIINAHMAGFQGGKTMRTTPRDWGYTWDGKVWSPGPLGPVGGTFNPATQRFE